ncbi:condensation domain-containing protein, partial [Burkholderia gladioli]|uniref:condensation domain-containing protein n=1 Tax=Burkholderia gladioli TaxID=28095 RepID=UPI00163F20E0
MMLDALPLTPNGKLDRLALPAVDASHAQGAYLEPRTETEATLARIWAAVLKLDRVGALDNFFDLGGHSLLATQMLSRLREALGVDLPLRALFEAPVLADLAARADIARRNGTGTTPPAITRTDRGARLPLSHTQQRLWFLDQLEPGSAFYNLPAAVRLHGELDVDALRRTLNAVIERHEVLRTRFVAHDGVPAQVIVPASDVALPLTDLSAQAEADREDALHSLLAREAGAGFDLAAGSLIRAHLVRLGVREHVVSLTLHHIVSDGWSTGVLVREVAALYDAFSRGEPSPLPALSVQYADYAHWQHAWLSGAVLDRQLDYWQGRLAGAPTLLNLPTDRPRPAVQRHRGALHGFEIAEQTTEALRQMARRAEATLFMTLASGFAALLSRYSGDTDITIGTPIANRSHSQTEALIGSFANTLVLREQVEAGDSFTSLLARMRETTLGAYAHQDVPFEQLVELLQPARSLAHAPLFQVMLALHNAPFEAMQLPGLELSPVGRETGSAKFDLTLNLEEVDGGLRGVVEYDTDLFDAVTIERLAVHFVCLLKAMVAAPEARIAGFGLVTGAERSVVIDQWNETFVAPSPEPAWYARFEAQADRTPDAIAVTDDEQALSYGELNRRANRLAHQLRGIGVGPDVCVGVCMERTAAMMVALLAVLKAGGAYVPMDPAYPAQRLAHMLADARPAVVLTQAGQRELVDSLATDARDWRIVDLDEALQAASGPGTNPALQTLAQHLAYVIYTSGSTGVPKGVGVTHASLLNLLESMRMAPGLGHDDVMLGLTSLSFDIAALELFLPLLVG